MRDIAFSELFENRGSNEEKPSFGGITSFSLLLRYAGGYEQKTEKQYD